MLAAGHPDPWSYTPKQIQAFQFIAGKRRMQELIQMLAVVHMGAKGKNSEVKKQITQWRKASD